jgi:hypothetical protein
MLLAFQNIFAYQKQTKTFMKNVSYKNASNISWTPCTIAPRDMFFWSDINFCRTKKNHICRTKKIISRGVIVVLFFSKILPCHAHTSKSFHKICPKIFNYFYLTYFFKLPVQLPPAPLKDLLVTHCPNLGGVVYESLTSHQHGDWSPVHQ